MNFWFPSKDERVFLTDFQTKSSINSVLWKQTQTFVSATSYDVPGMRKRINYGVKNGHINRLGVIMEMGGIYYVFVKGRGKPADSSSIGGREDEHREGPADKEFNTGLTQFYKNGHLNACGFRIFLCCSDEQCPSNAWNLTWHVDVRAAAQ